MPPPSPPDPPAFGIGLSVTVADATRVVRAGSRPGRVLDGVTLQLLPGEFVGVIGASGSGKSSLVRVIAGLDRLTTGEVRLAGVPRSADRLRTDRRVAYLPQDVVVHEALTPTEALGYGVRLRGLGTPGAASRALVRTALERVGVADRADVVFARLSGGQRKRVALAAELLGDPGLVLLDEPTSGLDPATEADMVDLFRSLADEGRTVVCVTHSPGHLHKCDRLVVMADGLCVFHGPPVEATRFFGVDTAEGIYLALDARPAGEWRERFATNFPARVSPSDHTRPTPLHMVPPPVLRPVAQAMVLTCRYARLQLADPRALLFQLAQAPAIGLMIGLTFGDVRSRFAEQHAADARQLLFLLVVAVLWCAGAGSAREVVKEFPVIRHEVRFGLDLRAYLLSKFTLLGGLALLQAGVLLAIVGSLAHPPGAQGLQFLVLGATALAGVGLGLLISASAGTSERAMTILPVALIGLAVFSGGLARLGGPALWISWFASPAFWALDGLKALIGAALGAATYPGAPGTYQPPILGTGGPLAIDLLALVTQTSAMLGMAYLAVRRRIAT